MYTSIGFFESPSASLRGLALGAAHARTGQRGSRLIGRIAVLALIGRPVAVANAARVGRFTARLLAHA
jgi:hypothetical protein